MINLAVISIKDIINFIKKIIIFFIMIIIILKVIGCIKKGNYIEIEDLKTKSFYDYCKIIDNALIISSYYNSDKIVNHSGIKKILGSELSILANEEELMEIENQEEVVEFEHFNADMQTDNNIKESDSQSSNNGSENTVENQENIAQKLEDIPSSLTTKVIEKNNKTDTYTDVYKSVKIKNESKYQLTEEILTPNFIPQNVSDVVIYHTHTCESYTPTEKDNYVASGNFRTTDLNYSVARVGTELENYLINTFNVKHDTTYHDYPAYSGSYTRSLATIKSIIPEDYSRTSNRFAQRCSWK